MNSKIEVPNNSQILMANKIVKYYDKFLALNDFSFSLGAGRILGFLGPNGAGKTTAIRILTTILEPSSGEFAIGGYDADRKREIRNIIGVLPESHGFPKHMTGLEYLLYFARLYGRDEDDAKSIVSQLLIEVGLEKRKNSLIGNYSRGMRQRLGIARTLINDPKVMFLDEPTLGLDPKGQEELLALIRDVAKKRNAGIIICSHLLSEIESICDDVIILQAGKIVASGTVEEIIGKGKIKLVRIKIPENEMLRATEILQNMEIIKDVKTSERLVGGLDIELNDIHQTKVITSNSLLNELIKHQIPILKFDTVGTGLHEVFLQITEEVAV